MVENSAVKRLPDWVKKPSVPMSRLREVKKILRERNLNTVCESARCPNIGECFSKPTATFMILGDRCTRDCGFCGVHTDAPVAVDVDEPVNIASACKELKLKHVVITSVTRDDLADGGASQFALTISSIRDTLSDILIELLIPDFNGDSLALEEVLKARPDILNHNLETVPSLYNVVRPGADYKRSLELIKTASEAGLLTKSGIMLGFGEEAHEVHSLLDDLALVGCRIVTIGQYLRPTRDNLEVKEYVLPEIFDNYGDYAKEAGIDFVYSAPMVRSSYNAEEIWTNFTE
ncbi:MAG: lipoyl synthase [Proteobacteria bacterium]|nr:lipoyl synthase [Pseudomonadota bacterium]